MKLSEELSWRGFVNQTTFSDITAVDNSPISFYFGVDPSVDSMTIGNFCAMMMVRHFIDHGHKAYLLVGGATGLIGDPDGKASERNLKTVDEINKNKANIDAQFKQVMVGKEFTIVDNYDWFKDIKYIDFLHDIGKNVPTGQMLSRDFVKSRLGSDGTGISYAEFSYSLIQGYDFLHLFREYGVTLQLCGADQWGNSVTGVDLVRRIENKEVNVFSTPLIVNKSTGEKFGKTEAGAVWLDANKTSVYQFYQFWLNIEDENTIDYLKIYTMLDKQKIDELGDQLKNDPSKRIAQKTLAHEVTQLVHGTEKTESVERVTRVLFGADNFESLKDSDLSELAKEIPVIEKGKLVTEILVDSRILTSKGEARRLIDGGAISINNEKVDQDKIVESPALIKKGKNSFVLVR